MHSHALAANRDAHALGIATIGEYGHDVAVVDRLRHLGVRNVKLENGNS
jgi:hypothetical protein